MASDVKDFAQSPVNTCLQCRVCKLCHPIVLKDNTKVIRFKNSYWIAVHFESGCINVLNICKRPERNVHQYSFSNVSSVSWKQDRSVEHLYVLDNDKNIREHSLQGTSPPMVQQWSCDKVLAAVATKGVSRIDSLSVIECVSSTCLLLVNNNVFVSLLLADDGECSHVGTLDIPECRQGPDLFDFVSGCLWGQVDLQFSKLDLTNRMQWRMSHDFTSLIVISQDWMLHTLALDIYIKTYPKSMKTESTMFNPYKKQLFLPSHSTCHLGDTKWKERLLSLHEQQHLHQNAERKMTTGHPCNTSGRKKVTSFKSSKIRSDRLETETLIEGGELPSELHEFTLVDMAVGTSTLTLSLVGHKPSEKKALCVINTLNHKILLKSIGSGQTIVLSPTLAHTHLIVSDIYIFHVVTEAAIEQEDLVSKLMLYGGASAADKLCDFNKWGRCTVPLHTLQIGIQHRQLDTVAFFLKSKENLFTSNKQKPSISPSSSVEEAQLWASQFCHLDHVRQLESALNLLVQAVKENVTDQQSRDFANKLLTLTLEFLYALVHNGLSLYRSLSQTESAVNERQDVEKSVDVLMGHIAQLRQCLTLSEQGRRKLIVGDPDVDHVDQDVPDGSVKTTSWSHLAAEEAVEAATMKNELPLLQSRLLMKGLTDRARYDHLISSGLGQILCYLNNRDMKSAKQMLENMGFDASSKLWELAEQVKNRELQMFIVGELHASGSLTTDQLGQVTFLSALYKLYPCSSFSQAMLQKTGQKDSAWSEENVLASLMKRTIHEVNSVCGDVGESGSLTSQEGLYAEVLLEWLKSWDSEIRERILLEGQFNGNDFIVEMYPNRKLLWQYLLSHNRHDDALTLLDLMIREVSEDGSSAKQRQDCLADLYNDLDLCTGYLQTEVTQRLMRKGYIQSEMLTDFPALMSGLTRMGGVLCSPHPLHHMDRHTLRSFHQQFLAYCAQHHLVLPLWIYCSKHRLQLDQTDVESPSMRSWLTSLQHFFSISRNPDDTDAIYQASLSCAAHIWNMSYPSLADMIIEDHVTASIATLPYSPTPLQQLSDVMKIDVFEGIDQDILQSKLKEFPKLYSALFPTGVVDTPRLDVSVYQLLVGSAPLDPRRLFGWQTGNSVAGEECQRSLPFFSQPELVSRFAYTEKIRYPYYLKHGRPTYAFLSFLAEEVDSGTTTISSKRIYTVCGVALWIAVKNFTNCMITSACVAFVEMCGQDSLLLRSYIQAGNDILAYKNTGFMGNVDKRKEVLHTNEESVVDILQSCIRHRRQHGPRLIELLERAVCDAVSRKGLNSTSFDAAHHWFLTMAICHQLHLPLSTVFLVECAQSDSWLPFLWFSQFHQFPKQQLQGLLHQFRSRHLRDHLHYVIENADAKSTRKLSSTQADTQAQTLTKDVRSSLYAKIGLSKGRDQGDVSSDEEEEHRILNFPSGPGSSMQHEQPVDLTLTEDSAPEDVFQVVFSSQSSSSPWKSLLQAAIVLRNSLFAELAACHQDAPVAPCLCGWLVAMMDRTEHAQFIENHGKSASSWCMAELETLIDVYMRQHWEYTLATGFDIFQTNSPLLPFLKFLAELSQGKNYAVCTSLLGDFKEAMSSILLEDKLKILVRYRLCDLMLSQVKKSEYAQHPVLGNSHWLEQTANRLLQHQLVRTSSLYEAVQLVQLLDQENIALVFSFDVPDYSRLHKLVQILHANKLAAISIPALLTPGDEACNVESKKAVTMLIEKKSFVDAYKFAHLVDIPCDEITLQEMSIEKTTLVETLVWKSQVARSRFWKTCANKFKLNQVSVNHFIEFFKREADEVSDMSEKASIYQLCLDLIPNSQSADGLYDDIYRQMWNCRIQAKISQQKAEIRDNEEPVEAILSVLETTDTKKVSADKSELLSLFKIPTSRRHSQVSTEILTFQETDALDSLINQLLDEGKIRESHQVTSAFGHYSQDLVIILTCIGLSQGEVNRETMAPDMRRLLTVDRRSRSSIGSFSGSFSRSASSVSLASIVPSWDFLTVDKEDAIVAMEKLQGHCNHGQQSCLRVITAFKVACVLALEYEDIVKGKEFAILDDLLRTMYPQRFQLARDYLSTSSLSDDQVSSFLSVSIINTLKVCMGGNTGSGIKTSSTKDLMFNPTERVSMFNQFIKLCQDPSRLGDHLLEAVSAMGDNSDDLQNRQMLSIQTELLILAHECHTVACSMEGISNILRAARICTDSLTKAEEFSLMIRLLTGVGRFSEMTYIFDALKHHHQFELLLRKGMEREDNLKTAVLDYLKRFHPDDKDSYTMVALKFTMYREIAHMLEENGRRNLHTIRDKPLENTREVQDILKESARYFSDAAESYVKDSCLRHAQQCLRQARLLALQLQHLASGIQVINLTPEGVTALLAQHPKFMESLIVSEAYGKRADWSGALYHNVILGSDFRYLQDLKSHIHLTSTMIQDAITRFQQSNNTSPQAITNVKKLLPFCKDICMQYRIAKDLHLNDVTQSMLKSDSGSYLQDMMSLS